jgi:hypothetical protein
MFVRASVYLALNWNFPPPFRGAANAAKVAKTAIRGHAIAGRSAYSRFKALGLL